MPTETFREVEPLWLDGMVADRTYPDFLSLHSKCIGVTEARKLRDWLNSALPETDTCSTHIPAKVDCQEHVEHNTANALEEFVHFHDPGSDKWRIRLSNLLAQARGDWETETCGCYNCIEVRKKNGWVDNVEMLLSGCPYTIRAREGGGPENLILSLVLTFSAMQKKLLEVK
jgi:hypothetical protein